MRIGKLLTIERSWPVRVGYNSVTGETIWTRQTRWPRLTIKFPVPPIGWGGKIWARKY